MTVNVLNFSDTTGKKLYETGVKKGVLYTMSGAVGAEHEYDVATIWNGLTSVSESPTGAESNALYADDVKYADLMSTEEFEATIGAYTYPKEFEACDGSKELVDGSGVSAGQQARAVFGLSYVTTVGNDVDGNDHGYKIHLIYGAKASPSEKAYNTINDSPEAIEFSWSITTTPVSIGDGFKPTASVVIDSTKADASKLKKLEEALYGKAESSEDAGDGVSAYLPLPSELMAMFA